MARIKAVPPSKAFQELHDASKIMQENNDCTVKAVAIVTGIPYQQAHKKMADMGRKNGRGAFGTERAIRELGFNLKKVDIGEIIASYPKPHCKVLKNFTTHHPRRFPGCIDASKVYLAFSSGHAIAIKDGVVHCWSINRALRIISLYEVTPK